MSSVWEEKAGIEGITICQYRLCVFKESTGWVATINGERYIELPTREYAKTFITSLAVFRMKNELEGFKEINRTWPVYGSEGTQESS